MFAGLRVLFLRGRQSSGKPEDPARPNQRTAEAAASWATALGTASS